LHRARVLQVARNAYASPHVLVIGGGTGEGKTRGKTQPGKKKDRRNKRSRE